MNFKICVGSSSKWLIGRKLGEDENIKFEYLRNEESFLDEIKNIFHNFWRAIIWWKTKTKKKLKK